MKNHGLQSFYVFITQTKITTKKKEDTSYKKEIVQCIVYLIQSSVHDSHVRTFIFLLLFKMLTKTELRNVTILQKSNDQLRSILAQLQQDENSDEKDDICTINNVDAPLRLSRSEDKGSPRVIKKCCSLQYCRVNF